MNTTSTTSSKVEQQATAELAKGHRSRVSLLICLGVVLVTVMVAVSAIGSTPVSVSTVYRILIHHTPFLHTEQQWAPTIETIVFDIRMPRIVLAAIVGGCLGIAGGTYQGLFRNPLADPYLIGVAQGAGLGAVVGFLVPVGFLGAGLGVIPPAAFLGALGAAASVYMLARVQKTLPVTTLILAGVAVGSFLTAVTFFLVMKSGDQARGMVSWILGGLALADWNQVLVLLPYAVVGGTIICLHSRSLNVMQLDEEQAQQLGIYVERDKLVLLGAATLITAAAVAFAGTIGFVGIIVPHTVRLIWGPDHRYLLPFSAIVGALFLVLADTIVRSLGGLIGEVPIGVVTALVGAPFFLYLLRLRKQAVFW